MINVYIYIYIYTYTHTHTNTHTHTHTSTHTADILLLDEPTNHLDVKNVAWLEEFLVSQTHKTSMIISHDSGFLDRVTTHIIHYEDNRKLKNYKVALHKMLDFITVVIVDWYQSL